MKQVPIAKQWDLFQRLAELVDSAEIAMPRQVIKETAEVAHPDAPGVWARGMQKRLRHPLDVDFEHVQAVMAVAPKLAEPNQQGDPADPYVAALAVQLRKDGMTVEVVTDDVIDHLPVKLALATACDLLKIDHRTASLRKSWWLEALLFWPSRE
jgi:hypothetical protein